MMKENLKNSPSRIIIFSFISFLIFLQPSLSVLITDINDTNTSSMPNYTLIEILPPDNVYEEFVSNPDSWNNVFSDTKQLPSRLGITVSETLTSISVADIANSFNAVVNVNNAEYAFSYIKVPNENYEGIVNAYKNLGFEVKNVTYLKPQLNESVNSMNLPFSYETSPGQFSTLTGSGRRIAILDTGVDDTHRDFAGRLRFWSDVAEGIANYTDYDAHGTHVASTAAGSGTESSGKYRGVAPEADLYIFKISDPFGSTYAWMANAVNQAINQNVDVISMSFGGTATAALCNNQVPGDARAFFNAVQNALANNIVVVFSAGNNGPNGGISYPACIQGVIAVGSTAKKDYPNNIYNPLTYYDDKIAYRYKLNVNVNSQIVGQFNANAGSIVTNLEQVDGFPLTRETGVHFTLQPNSWPANINFNLESEHKDRPCYSGADVWWDPAGRSSGDDFWNLASQNFAAGPYVGFEILLRSHQNEGGWGCCPLETEPWYNSRTNTFSCTGTAKVCNDFDSDRSGCENQLGCSWCGCFLCSPYSCWCEKDTKQEDCKGSFLITAGWLACDGTPKSCNDGSRIGWPYRCGSPDTTGCTGTWTQDSETYRNIFIKNTLGTKDFVSFFSSRGPALNGLNKPEVTAPGEFICAAKSSEIDKGRNGWEGLDICGNSKYHAASGTSMAAPHVSGVVALLRQANPTATVNDIRNILLNTADPAGYGVNIEGQGRVNAKSAIDAVCDLRDRWVCSGSTRQFEDYYCPGGPCTFKITQQKNCNDYDRGYADDVNDPSKCQGYNYASYTSANQMRDYSCSNGNCICNVIFDSYINSVSVNGATSGDQDVLKSSNIVVDVDVKNTGSGQQQWWFTGVEFWKVNDYNDPWNTRGQGVYTYYNGKDRTHGNQQGVNGADCSVVSDPNSNGFLDSGETIRVRCQIPASYYGPTTGNQRIMFWVHERDLGQDAGNNGNAGNDWWDDALAKSKRTGVANEIVYGGPADIKVNIFIPDGGYPDVTMDPPKCQNYNYFDYSSANQMRDYTGSNCNVIYDSSITNFCLNNNCENYNSPLVYYKFDEGSGNIVHDSSGNARDGTIQGNVWVDGYREKALNFTGLDYVKVPYNMNNIYNLSIEAWVKMKDYLPGKYFALAAKTGEQWNATDIDYDYAYTFIPPSSISFYYKYGKNRYGCGANTVKNLIDDKWHHLAVTFNPNGNLTFYIDGNKTREIGSCGPINLSSYNTRIAQMIGSMDEVKIYNKIIDYESQTTYNSSYITADVDVKNTGSGQQQWWFTGVEFWKVNDYNDPWNTRGQGVYTYYNGKDRTHGNQQGVNGADCSVVSDPNNNGFLDSGETIRVRCQIPASYYGPTTNNQRIMFWVHERDLGQDAGNNGNAGNDWWDDALAKLAPTIVKNKIICRDDAEDSDGGLSYKVRGICTDYYQGGSNCRSTQYTDSCINSTALREYYVSDSTCGSVTKNCLDYGSIYYCSSGMCLASGGGCLVEGTKILTPNGFKNIEDIQIGDIVIGYKDGNRVETKVTRKVIHFGFWDIYYYRGSWFTETHKIYPSLDGEATIASMLSNTKKQYSGKVYDVETGTHNYFGENELLIHNMFMKR